MCIGGSGLCMEGEQRKKISRKPGEPVSVIYWSQDHKAEREQTQGAGGVTDTEWSQSIM